MSNEVALIEERIKQQLAVQQKQAAVLGGEGNYISFKNGNMKVNETPVPKNSLQVRVLAAVRERAWYSEAYDPDTPQSPACWALGDEDVPDESCQDQQYGNCASCPKNKFGSAPPRPGSTKPGRGKACREGIRLVVAPAGVDMKVAILYMAKIPATSIKQIDSVLQQMNQVNQLYGDFICELTCTEDKKSFFKVGLTIVKAEPVADRIVLLNKQDEAMQKALQPFADFSE